MYPPIVSIWARPDLYKLEADYTVTVDGVTILIPKGFIYDGASVPRIFWWLVDTRELGAGAAAVHDWGYEHGGRFIIVDKLGNRGEFLEGRKGVDRLLRNVSRLENTLWWRRTYSLPLVRAFGRWSWNKPGHTEKELV